MHSFKTGMMAWILRQRVSTEGSLWEPGTLPGVRYGCESGIFYRKKMGFRVTVIIAD